MNAGPESRDASPAGEITISLPSDSQIVAVRSFAASRDRVFAAFVEPRLIERWWGPVGWQTTVETLDLRVGGHYRIRLTGPNGEVRFRDGVFREIVPGTRLVRTLGFGEFPGLRVVETVRFEDIDGGTRVTLRTEFPSPPEPERLTAAGIQNGVRSLLHRLEQLLRDETAEGS